MDLDSASELVPVIETRSVTAEASPGTRRQPFPLRCKVSGCTSDLVSAPKTHQRFRLCNTHIKAPVINVDGVASRFCQQCSRFHALTEFHGTNRTCEMMLVKNRARQRHATTITTTATPAVAAPAPASGNPSLCAVALSALRPTVRDLVTPSTGLKELNQPNTLPNPATAVTHPPHPAQHHQPHHPPHSHQIGGVYGGVCDATGAPAPAAAAAATAAVLRCKVELAPAPEGFPPLALGPPDAPVLTVTPEAPRPALAPVASTLRASVHLATATAGAASALQSAAAGAAAGRGSLPVTTAAGPGLSTFPAGATAAGLGPSTHPAAAAAAASSANARLPLAVALCTTSDLCTALPGRQSSGTDGAVSKGESSNVVWESLGASTGAAGGAGGVQGGNGAPASDVAVAAVRPAAVGGANDGIAARPAVDDGSSQPQKEDVVMGCTSGSAAGRPEDGSDPSPFETAAAGCSAAAPAPIVAATTGPGACDAGAASVFGIPAQGAPSCVAPMDTDSLAVAIPLPGGGAAARNPGHGGGAAARNPGHGGHGAAPPPGAAAATAVAAASGNFGTAASLFPLDKGVGALHGGAALTFARFSAPPNLGASDAPGGGGVSSGSSVGAGTAALLHRASLAWLPGQSQGWGQQTQPASISLLQQQQQKQQLPPPALGQTIAHLPISRHQRQKLLLPEPGPGPCGLRRTHSSAACTLRPNGALDGGAAGGGSGGGGFTGSRRGLGRRGGTGGAGDVETEGDGEPWSLSRLGGGGVGGSLGGGGGMGGGGGLGGGCFARMSAPPGDAGVVSRCGSGRCDAGTPPLLADLQSMSSGGSFKRRRSLSFDMYDDYGSATVRQCSSPGTGHVEDPPPPPSVVGPVTVTAAGLSGLTGCPVAVSTAAAAAADCSGGGGGAIFQLRTTGRTHYDEGSPPLPLLQHPQPLPAQQHPYIGGWGAPSDSLRLAWLRDSSPSSGLQRSGSSSSHRGSVSPADALSGGLSAGGAPALALTHWRASAAAAAAAAAATGGEGPAAAAAVAWTVAAPMPTVTGVGRPLTPRGQAAEHLEALGLGDRTASGSSDTGCGGPDRESRGVEGGEGAGVGKGADGVFRAAAGGVAGSGTAAAAAATAAGGAGGAGVGAGAGEDDGCLAALAAQWRCEDGADAADSLMEALVEVAEEEVCPGLAAGSSAALALPFKAFVSAPMPQANPVSAAASAATGPPGAPANALLTACYTVPMRPVTLALGTAAAAADGRSWQAGVSAAGSCGARPALVRSAQSEPLWSCGQQQQQQQQPLQQQQQLLLQAYQHQQAALQLLQSEVLAHHPLPHPQLHPQPYPDHLRSASLFPTDPHHHQHHLAQLPPLQQQQLHPQQQQQQPPAPAVPAFRRCSPGLPTFQRASSPLGQTFRAHGGTAGSLGPGRRSATLMADATIATTAPLPAAPGGQTARAPSTSPSPSPSGSLPSGEVPLGSLPSGEVPSGEVPSGEESVRCGSARGAGRAGAGSTGGAGAAVAAGAAPPARRSGKGAEEEARGPMGAGAGGVEGGSGRGPRAVGAETEAQLQQLLLDIFGGDQEAGQGQGQAQVDTGSREVAGANPGAGPTASSTGRSTVRVECEAGVGGPAAAAATPSGGGPRRGSNTGCVAIQGCEGGRGTCAAGEGTASGECGGGPPQPHTHTRLCGLPGPLGPPGPEQSDLAQRPSPPTPPPSEPPNLHPGGSPQFQLQEQPQGSQSAHNPPSRKSSEAQQQQQQLQMLQRQQQQPQGSMPPVLPVSDLDEMECLSLALRQQQQLWQELLRVQEQQHRLQLQQLQQQMQLVKLLLPPGQALQLPMPLGPLPEALGQAVPQPLLPQVPSQGPGRQVSGKARQQSPQGQQQQHPVKLEEAENELPPGTAPGMRPPPQGPVGQVDRSSGHSADAIRRTADLDRRAGGGSLQGGTERPAAKSDGGSGGGGGGGGGGSGGAVLGETRPAPLPPVFARWCMPAGCSGVEVEVGIGKGNGGGGVGMAGAAALDGGPSRGGGSGTGGGGGAGGGQDDDCLML